MKATVHPFQNAFAGRFFARCVTFLLLTFSSACVFSAPTTNYYDPAKEKYHCVVCGKGPLNGTVWTHERGVICDDCEKLKDRCTICGLPVKEGDGHIKTGDGRFICRFDKGDVILTADQAKELFEQTRDAVVDLYGPQFALKNTQVTVNLFDVDYWSEKGRTNQLHTFGFAHSRPADGGKWTHEVVMLSGRTRQEMTSVAAHEYTHLWINENCPDKHKIDGDTVEAICELTAYKLMEQKKLTGMEQRILKNPYTNGKIRTLVSVERDGGMAYVLNWVRASQADTFDENANLAPIPAPSAPVQILPGPQVLPSGLKFSGIMVIGTSRLAVINGVAFSAGEHKVIKLHDKTVGIRCALIRDAEVVIEPDNSPKSLTLTRGMEVPAP